MAVAVAAAVCGGRDLSLAVQAALIAAAIATFLALAMAMKIALGREALIYYHHAIAVLLVTAIVARILGAPVLDHLDATALGLGMFVAFGRVGCLFAGCCHGRPARAGVLYGDSHADGGPPAYLLGTALFPVQALEAASVTALVALAAATATSGAAVAVYLTGYAVARFGLEELRGDLWRPYRLGLSAAQWTSLAVACVVASLALAGALPHPALHLVATVALALAALVVARRRAPSLLDSRHVRELSSLLPVPRPGSPAVRETSLGVRCSAGLDAGRVHYTLSRPGGALGSDDASALARVILWLRHPREEADLLPGPAGTFHLLVSARGPTARA